MASDPVAAARDQSSAEVRRELAYVAPVAQYRAVFFDWMLTLAHYPSNTELCAAALRSLGRDTDPAAIEAMVRSLALAWAHKDVTDTIATLDTSAHVHRATLMRQCELAVLDDEFAKAWYELLGSADMHPLYPDAARTLAALQEQGTRVAVISDIHVDLRTHAERFGISGLVDHWALSFELGVQKPDPTMFRTALDALQLSAEDVLMVGDRASHDGAAALLGIDTLILPPPKAFGVRGLERVLRLAN